MQIGQLEFEMFGKSYLIESKNKQSDFKLEIEQIRGPFESSNMALVIKSLLRKI